MICQSQPLELSESELCKNRSFSIQNMINQSQHMELSEPEFESVSNMSYAFGTIWDEQRAIEFEAKFEALIAEKESDVNARLICETGKSMNWPSNLEMGFTQQASYCVKPKPTKSNTISEILDELDKRKRQTPKALSFVEPVYKDDPKLFIAKPGELVKLNCPDTDLTPVTIDVVSLTNIFSTEALVDVKGWRLSFIIIVGPRHIKPINIAVRFICEGGIRENGTIYSLDEKKTIGEWSIRKEDGFALWQQPSNWSMICQRAVTHRLHIELFEDKRKMDMIMLFDKIKNQHYLQQDSSFYQMNECVMIADTSRNPGWSAQPIHTR
jgi:hypothetical protein